MKQNPPKFTKEDLADWKAYEKVRTGGRWNMFDPRARKATRLSSERYLFVMHWFSELKAAIENSKAP